MLNGLREEVHGILWPMITPDLNEAIDWNYAAGLSLDTTGMVYKGKEPSIGTVWKIDVSTFNTYLMTNLFLLINRQL